MQQAREEVEEEDETNTSFELDKLLRIECFSLSSEMVFYVFGNVSLANLQFGVDEKKVIDVCNGRGGLLSVPGEYDWLGWRFSNR